MTLIPGSRYKVLVKSGVIGNRPYEMVATYLGELYGGQVEFSLRPLAGTARLRRRDIVAIEPTTAAILKPTPVVRGD